MLLLIVHQWLNVFVEFNTDESSAAKILRFLNDGQSNIHVEQRIFDLKWMNKYSNLNLNFYIDKKFHGILTISDTHRKGNPKKEKIACLKMKTFIINRTVGGYLEFGINRH